MAETGRPLTGSGACRRLFRFAAIAYLGMLVALPLGTVAWRTFDHGPGPVWKALGDPAMVHAFQLTAIVAGMSVLVDAVLGTGLALLLVRYRFPGRRILDALVDLPLSVSPVVVGLALILVYGQDGWLRSVSDAGFKIIFAVPGMVMATVFVSFPLMVREVAPVLEQVGFDQEEAARTLGASGWQTFRRVTLPSIRWGAIYGIVLSVARSLGEFGAIKVVSGNLVGQTQTATLVVEQAYQDFDQRTAFAVSFILAAVAISCLVLISLARAPGEER